MYEVFIYGLGGFALGYLITSLLLHTIFRS